jgi:hypothetical protein
MPAFEDLAVDFAGKPTMKERMPQAKKINGKIPLEQAFAGTNFHDLRLFRGIGGSPGHEHTDL